MQGQDGQCSQCLTKDPSRRLRDMGDARLELDEPAGEDSHIPA
jgi:hypothetical protein